MDALTREIRFAHAADGEWADMTAACLERLTPLPAGANLGFVYVTDAVAGDFGDIAARLKTETGIADWVGTVGFGICAGFEEQFDRPAMAVMAAALPGDSFCILPTVADPEGGLPDEVRAWCDRHTPMLGVVHGDARNPELEPLLEMIQRDSGCFLVGGLTASRGEQPQLAAEVTDGGISGVLFDADIGAVTGLTQGCAPIGPVHDITGARENVLIGLDGRSAHDVFVEDIGELLARDLSRVEGYVHAALPIAGSDMGDYRVRNLVGVDPEKGWVAIGENVDAGDRVMFVRRDGPSAMTDLKRMVDDVKARAGGSIRAALYFSCIARGPNLFGEGSVELGAVAEALGDVPLIGFYANGEISNHRLYGYTGVLTLLT